MDSTRTSPVTKKRRVRLQQSVGAKPLPVPPVELLADLRFALGLRQRDVADRSGGQVSLNSYSLVEIRRSKLTVRKTFRGIAKGLGITEEELDALLEQRLAVDVLAARVLEREPALREGAARAAALAKGASA